MPATRETPVAYARLGRDGELWAPLMEKAYAFFRYGQNSYGSIEGGWMDIVDQEVANSFGVSRGTGGSAQTLYNYLSSELAAGHSITAASYSNASGPIVGSHAYMVKSVETSGAGMFVTVYNPWGVDGRSWDSNSGDGLLKISIGDFQRYFQAAIVCTA